MVGKLAAKEDFNPGLESSKAIELFLFIPLNWIAFKYGNGFGFFNSTSSLEIMNSNGLKPLNRFSTSKST